MVFYLFMKDNWKALWQFEAKVYSSFKQLAHDLCISPRDLKIVHFQIHLGFMLYYWLKALSSDWLVDLLINWLNDWIFDWQLIYWLTTWLIDWLSNCLATCNWLTDYNNWLTDGLTDWLTYWWPDWLTCTWQQTDSLNDKMSNLLLTDWLIN